MDPLTLPAPEIAAEPPGPTLALEKPATIRIGPVLDHAGQPVPADAVRTIGAFIYRGPIGAEELWDEAARAWAAPAPLNAEALATLKPLGLAPQPGGESWTGTLVAAGAKDGDGQPKFAAAALGAPVYRLRAYASALVGGEVRRGLSAPSADFTFFSATAARRFAIALDTDDAETAGQVRIMLRNGALEPAGYLEIRASGGQEVEIANTAGGAVLARVTLAASGDIRLEPAAGRSIVLDGPLEAERVSYMPQGGGARQSL